jgi:peptidoglycan/xylan/chitin deacetylase (PgdA/CDA1 family)
MPPAGHNPVRQAVKRALDGALPRSAFLARGPRHDGAVALTFDDGPDPERTPRLLDRLRELDVRATFFVIGAHAEDHPDLLRRMRDEGHAIGHHSWFHGEPAQTSAATLLRETRRLDRLLSVAVGARSRLVRPPKGHLSPAKLAGLWAAGKAVVLWNVDPADYACAGPSEVRRRFTSRPVRAGDVVLLHDTHPHAHDILPDLVEDARARGLRFVTCRRWTHG